LHLSHLNICGDARGSVISESQVKQINIPIMLREIIKNAGQAIILAAMPMPPSTGHKWSLNGLMSMKTM
jgi:hypothetical protein